MRLSFAVVMSYIGMHDQECMSFISYSISNSSIYYITPISSAMSLIILLIAQNLLFTIHMRW